MNIERQFNNRLHLSFPDSFHVLDQEERKNLNVIAEGPGECLKDPESHIFISIGWKELNPILSLLVSAKDADGNSLKAIRSAMQPYGFEFCEKITRDIAGEKAYGFNYDYEAQGIRMRGETCVVKHKKVLYYLHLYIRRELKDESMKVWKEILASARWE